MLATGEKQFNRPVSLPVLLEIRTHLNRVGSALAELLATAANDNAPFGEQFEDNLNKALRDIDAILTRFLCMRLMLRYSTNTLTCSGGSGTCCGFPSTFPVDNV
jgi:hypothetical protein